MGIQFMVKRGCSRVWVAVVILTCIGVTSGAIRNRRSPHKKHTFYGGSEWIAPAPIPPPIEHTVVDHHHHTTVDHHHIHHHHIDYPPPPPPSVEESSIEIHGFKGKDDKFEEIKETLAEMEQRKKEKFEEIERMKQEKFEEIERKKQEMKESAERKLEEFSRIPQKIGEDLEFLGRKIKEDIDRKAEEEKGKGISIQIWKGKGGQVGGGGRDTVHHHHYHHPAEEQGRGDPGNLDEGVQAPTPRPPPRSDELFKFVDFFDAGTQYRPPPPEEQGKGFSISMWKAKGRR